MRVLVTWGSRGGGTEAIAAQVAAALADAGIDVELRAAREVDTFAEYRAAIIGGSVSANHWHRDARRFVTRHLTGLRRVPVWMFSSAADGDPARRATVAAVPQVAVLIERLGAQGHSGAWCNPAQIRAWAIDIAARLSTARPAPPVEPPGRSLSRLIAHGVAGWSACAVVMAGLLAITTPALAIALHALAAPVIFAAIARAYFGARGARSALPVAIAFAAIVGALDAAIVAASIRHSFAMFASLGATWLPLALIVLATWATGALSPMHHAAQAAQPGSRVRRAAGGATARARRAATGSSRDARSGRDRARSRARSATARSARAARPR
jgi:menaquinone-dependent protoporphyrinogen oxidase